MAGTSHNSPAMRQLNLIHCMDYAAMPDETKRLIPGLVNEALRPAGACIATGIALEGVSFQ